MSSKERKLATFASQYQQDAGASCLAPTAPSLLAISPAATYAAASSVFSKSETHTTATSLEPHSGPTIEDATKWSSYPDVYQAPIPRHVIGIAKSHSLPPVHGIAISEPNIPPLASIDQSLHASTPRDYRGVPDETLVDARKVGKSFRLALEVQTRVAQLRDQLLLAKSRLDHERYASQAAQDFLQESQAHLMYALQQSVASVKPDQANLLTKLDQAQADSSTHKMQVEKVKSLENSVYNLEYVLGRAEEEFAAETQRALETLPLLEQTEEDDDRSVRPASPAPLTDGSTPEELQDYWEALGDTEVLHDELFELDQEYQQKVAELERFYEQDVPLDRTLEEVSREHEHQRHGIQERAKLCNAKVEYLRSVCIKKGIDHTKSRKLPSECSTRPSQHRVMALPHQTQPDVAQSEPVLSLARKAPFFDVQLPTSQSSDQLPAQARVVDWLRQSALETPLFAESNIPEFGDFSPDNPSLSYADSGLHPKEP